MKTPKEYQENLNNKIITSKMLEDALYSVNKRAKNYRDAARKSRPYTNRFCAYDTNDVKKEEMYRYKEKMLSCINPTCVHKEFQGYVRIRVYDYESDYSTKHFQHMLDGTIVWQNYYIKNDRYDNYYDEDYREPGDIVYFFDYLDLEHPIYQYYLYYELGEHSFHTLIDNPKQYNLPIAEIGEITTFGDEINDLLSMQFIKKMLKLIDNKDYQYVVNTEVISKDYDNDIHYPVYEKASWGEIWDYLKEDIYEKCREHEQNHKQDYKISDFKKLSYKTKTRAFKHKVNGVKRKELFEIPSFNSSFKLNELIPPELSNDTIRVIKEGFSEDTSPNEFIELLFKTDLNKKYFNDNLYDNFRLLRLSKDLNNFVGSIYSKKPRSINANEVIENFIEVNQIHNNTAD